jgi:hypothetical protein
MYLDSRLDAVVFLGNVEVEAQSTVHLLAQEARLLSD